MTTAVEDAQELQAAQEALIVLLLSELDVLWDQLDVNNPADTLEQWLDAVTAVIENYAIAMGALVQELYLDQREDAGVDSEFDPSPIDAPSEEDIESALRWALSDLWDGGSIDDARDRLEAGAEKLVLDTARDTTAADSIEDPAAKGWARVARPDACYFCAMLATRGGVYSDRETALIAGPGSNRSGEEYHDHCRCVAVAVFEGQEYQPPAYVHEWNEIWKKSTKGLRGDDAMNAFRRALYPRHKDAINRAKRERYARRKAERERDRTEAA
jgi:hypothetical protein